MKLKLRDKVSIGICLFAVALIASILFVINFSLSRGAERKIREELLSAHEIFSAFQNLRFEQLSVITKTLTEMPQLKAVIATPGLDHATILDTALEAQRVVKSDLLILADAEGRLLASVSEPERHGEDLSVRYEFAGALRGDVFEGVWVSETDGKAYQVVAGPFIFGDQVVGALLTGFEVDQQLVTRLERMSDCQVGLWSGQSWLTSPSSEDLFSKFPPVLLATSAGASNNRILIQRIGGERYLVWIAPFGRSQASFVLARSAREELAFYRQLQYKLLIAAAGVLIAALLIGLFFSNRFTEPIRSLLAATKRIAGGDLDSKIVAGSDDEIGELADAFNNMAVELREQLHREKVLAGAEAAASTERERAAELGRLLALRDELVAKVSHELRTPLTSIKEGLSLLREDALGATTEEQRDFLQTMDSDVNRLAALVTDMLDLSKMEAGQMKLQRTRTDLCKLVEKTKTTYKSIIGNRTVLCECEEVPPAFADSDRLQQIFGNLLSNAIKFTRDDGKITFRVFRKEGMAAVAVEDDGEGISAEDLPKLFKKFVQVGNRDPNRPRGTGLGLVVCKELTELHGGRIDLASTLGVGTTFTVLLPVYTEGFALAESFREQQQIAAAQRQAVGLVAIRSGAPPASGAADEGQKTQLQDTVKKIRSIVKREDIVLDMEPHWIVLLSVADANGLRTLVRRLYRELAGGVRPQIGIAVYPDDGMDSAALFRTASMSLGKGLAAVEPAPHPGSMGNILLVDDEPNIVKMLSKRFETEGYKIIVAADGAEALAKVESEHPDLICLDLMLPGIDGYEVCRRLKEDVGYQHIPIVIYSVKEGPVDRQRAMECGANAYVSKSHPSDELLEQVRTQMARLRKQKQGGTGEEKA